MKLTPLMPVLLAVLLLSCSSPDEKFAAYVQNGEKLIAAGDIDKAKIEYKNALQIKKSDILALWGLVKVYEKERNLQKVYELCLTIVQQDPSFLNAQLKLASFYLASGKQEALSETLEILERLAPSQSEVLALKASVALKAKDVQQAVFFAKESLTADPANSDAVMVLATERASRGDIAQALRFLSEGISHNPQAVSLYFAKLSILRQTQAWHEVETLTQQLIQQFPTNTDYKRLLVRFYLEQKQPAKAEHLLNTLIKYDSADTKSKLVLIDLLNQTKGSDAARDRLNTMISNNPEDIDLQFARVQFEQSTGHVNEAIKWLENIAISAGRKESRLKAQTMLANQFFMDGNVQQAEKRIDYVLTEDQKNAQALLIKAKIKLKNQQYDDAVSHLRLLLDGAPQSVPLILELARAYDLSGADSLAEQQFVQAMKISKSDAQAVLAYSNFLLRRQEFDRVDSILKTLLQTTPEHVEANRLLAQSKINQRAWSTALQIAKRLKRQSLGEVYGYQVAAIVYFSQKQYQKAIIEFEQASLMMPENVELLNNLVGCYVAAGQPDQAIALLKKKIANRQLTFHAKVLLAEIYSKNQPAQAIKVYQALADEYPQYKEGALGLYQLLLKRGDAAQAKAVIEHASDKSPRIVDLQVIRANLYQQEGNIDAAIKIYDELVKMQPENILMRNNLVGLMIEASQDQSSLQQAYTLSLSLARSNIPNVRDTYGWAAYKVGRYQESIRALRYVVEKAPEVGLFHYHLAKAYLANQDKKNAHEALQAAVKHYDSMQGYALDEVRQLLKTAV